MAKKFKEWKIWEWAGEIILILIGVILGLLGDRYINSLAEKESEKTHVHMLLGDLSEDIYRLDSNSNVRCRREKKLDSLMQLLATYDFTKNAYPLYRLALSVDIYETFFRNDRTIFQFKNSGGTPIIKNDSVSAAIMDYDGYVISEIDWNNNIEASCIYHYKEIRYKLFKAQFINRLSSRDTTVQAESYDVLPASDMDINAIIGIVFQMKRISAVNRECALTARQKAVQLIETIKRQYNVNDFALNKKTEGCDE